MSRDIVFVNSLFPCLSETFIFDQFTALRDAGMSFHIVSNNRPAENQIHPRMRSIQEQVIYLCGTSLFSMILAHALAFFRHPLRYLRALTLIPSSEEKFSVALAQFTGAAIILFNFSHLKKMHLHAHFTYGAAAVALWAHRIAGVPYTLTLHGSDLIFDNPPDLDVRLEKAESIVSISQFNIDFLRAHFPKVAQHKLRLIRMGVSPLLIVQPRAAPTKYLRILNVGRLSVHKAQHDLISACAILRDQGFEFECVIVGEGDLRTSLQKQIAQLNLDNQVKLVGARFHDEVLDLYSQFDLFVLSSITEGQPIVLMEAMQAGIPIIATNISAIPELLQGAGQLIPPDSPPSIASAILDFDANREKYQTLAERAKQVVATDYNLVKNHLVFKVYLDELVDI